MDQESIWDKEYKNNLHWKKETISLPKIINGRRILEIGVGNGKTLRAIIRQSPKEVIAIDFSSEAIKKCKSEFKDNKNITFKQLSLVSLPFKEEFDIIICYYTLNNLLEEDRKKAVKSIQNSLKKKGKLIFEDFSIGDFRESGEQVSTHTIKKKNGMICHFFSEDELKSLFQDFSNIKIKTKESSPITHKSNIKRRIISLQASK